MKRILFILLLTIPFVGFGQKEYILNDSVLMMKLEFCYYGDSVVYNDHIDEFYGPLEKCSEGVYHTFIVDSNYYVVNPRTWEYSGSGGGHFFLYKRNNSEFTRIDHVWGDLDLEKTDLNSSVFFYSKTDKSTRVFKTYGYEIIIDKEKDQFLIKNKTLTRTW